MSRLEAWLAYGCLVMVCCTIGLCGYSEAQSKDSLTPVYTENGTIDYIVINGVEHQVLPTLSMDMLLDDLDTKTKQIELRDQQIASYQRISERQKADLEMCRIDRNKAYSQLDLCLAKETPFYQTNEFSFMGGYLACAASYAVWSATK
jgi:hypothetical protein